MRQVDCLLKEWGAPIPGPPVSADTLDEFTGALPPLLLDVWRAVGFSGFGAGKMWLCDPREWQPAVDAWTRDMPGGIERWHAVTRSAFGKFTLWDEETCDTVTVEPVHALVTRGSAGPCMVTDDGKDLLIFSHLYLALDHHDLLGQDGRPMFDRALSSHGPISASEVYGFVPAVALGGALDVDRVQVQDAVTHVRLLADLARG